MTARPPRRFLRDHATGTWAGSVANPNRTAGNRRAANLDTPDTTVGRTSQCPACGQFTSPGTNIHRCPHPGLITVDRNLASVLGVIDRAGGHSYLVGGCVRDAMLGRPSKDIDIEVYGRDLDELHQALNAAGIHVDPVGASFGVLKASLGDDDFDIAIPRRDSKIGDGHRGFSVQADHTLNELDASARRDFTINALMWDPATGDLVDCHGGLNDLDSMLLRHTGDAFAEDPLRVLRGVQFAGRFDMTLHPDTIAVCEALVGSYHELPVERVWTEWDKIARKADAPGRSLQALQDTGWMAHYPDLGAINDVPQAAKWHPEGSVDVHTRETANAAARIAERDGITGDDRQVLVFAAIAHDFGKATHTKVHEDGRITSHGHAEAGVEPAHRFLESIGCPSRLFDQVEPLVREHMCAATAEGPTPANVRRLARRLGGVPLELWAKVVEADNQGRGTASHPGPAGDWVRVARDIAVDRKPAKPILTGQQLIDRGMRPGPEFKTILAAAQDAQDAGQISDLTSAAAWLDGHLAS